MEQRLHNFCPTIQSQKGSQSGDKVMVVRRVAQLNNNMDEYAEPMAANR